MAGLCDWENDDDPGESTATGLASAAPRFEDHRREDRMRRENAKNGPVAFRNA